MLACILSIFFSCCHALCDQALTLYSVDTHFDALTTLKTLWKKKK